MSDVRNTTTVVLEKPRMSKPWLKRRASLLSLNSASDCQQEGATSLIATNCHEASQHSAETSYGYAVSSGITRRCNIVETIPIDKLGNLSLRCEEDPLCAPSSQFPTKKSGEVVKPVLKSKESNRRKSTRTIPTKFVHFDAQLEYIKLFMKGEKPQTISNPGSDLEDVTSSEDDLYNQDEISLSIRLPNFPPPTFSCYNSKIISLDSVSLSENKKDLNGSIQVANLAYHKVVLVRYTFDFWQTVEEVSAKFSRPTPKTFDNRIGIDEFSFSIKLESRVSLELGSPKKPLFFAIKYMVNDQEYWDNNDGMNYHVEFVLSRTKSETDPWDVPQSTCVASKSQPIDIKRTPLDVGDSLFASSPESPLTSFKSASSKKLSSRYDFEASLSALLASETSSHRKQFTSPQYLDFPTSDQIDHQCESYNHSTAYPSLSFPHMLNHEYDSYSSTSVESPFGNNSWEEPTYLVNTNDRFPRSYVSNTPLYIAPKPTNQERNSASPPSKDDSDLCNNNLHDELYGNTYPYSTSPPIACIRG